MKCCRGAFVLLLAAALAVASGRAFAEEATTEPGATAADTSEAGERRPARGIEEIVVTAQRKEESLHEVPISMSVLDSEFLSRQGVTDLREAALFTPNVRIDLNGFFIQPRVRGFSIEPLNRGAEQPVGLVLDGVPYDRAEYFQAGVYDLERIEILRGPQGTLFGKNTSVGLLNITTKDPTDELSGFIDGQFGELDRRRVEAGVGGPIVPGVLNFRIAGLTDELDGFMKNTTARVWPGLDDVLQDRDRKSFRAKLGLPNLAGADLLLSYERTEVDVGGPALEARRIPEDLQDFFLHYDPNFDFEPDNYVASKDGDESSQRKMDTVVARASYDLGGWGLDGIAGYSKMESADHYDFDNTAIPILFFVGDESTSQITSELRVTSPSLAGFFGLDRAFGFPLGSTDFTTGFLFQREKVDPSHGINFTYATNLALLLVENGRAGSIVGLPPDFVTPPLPLPPGFTGTEYLEWTDTFTRQTTNSYAGFGQMNWRLLDRLTLITASRLSYLTKHVTMTNQNHSNQPGDEAPVISGSVAEYVGAELDRDELHFSPKVGAKYDWSDDLNFYATWSRGFRAGGIGVFSQTGNLEEEQYEDESVTNWEIGSKWNLLGGAATLNLGLFWMTLSDFQVFTILPGSAVVTPAIVNAPEAQARGVETDATWLPTEWLTLRGALGFNDSEFSDFPIGTCEVDRPNTDGDGDPRCDLTGRPLVRAPKWNVSTVASVQYPLSFLESLTGSPILSGVSLTGGLTLLYEDNQYLKETLDPRTRQVSFVKLGANLGFANFDQGWSAGVFVENMTDEVTSSAVREIFQTRDAFAQSTDPPRLVFGKLRWTF